MSNQLVGQLQREKKELYDKIVFFREKYTSVVQSKTRLQEEIIAAEESKLQLVARVRSLEGLEQEYNALKSNYNMLLQQTQKEKKRAEETIQGFQVNVDTTVSGMKERIDQLEEEMKTGTDRIRDLEDDLQDKCEEVEDLTELLEAEQKRMNLIKEQLSKEQGENKSNMDKMQKQMMKSQPELAHEVEKRNELKKSLKDAKASVANMQLEVETLNNTLSKVNEEYRLKYANLLLKHDKELELRDKPKGEGKDAEEADELSRILTTNRTSRTGRTGRTNRRGSMALSGRLVPERDEEAAASSSGSAEESSTKKKKKKKKKKSSVSVSKTGEEPEGKEGEGSDDEAENEDFFIKGLLKNLVSTYTWREKDLVKQLSKLRKRVLDIAEEREELNLMVLGLEQQVESLPMNIRVEYGLEDLDLDDVPEPMWVDKEKTIAKYEKEKNKLLKQQGKLQQKLTKLMVKADDSLRVLRDEHKNALSEMQETIDDLKANGVSSSRRSSHVLSGRAALSQRSSRKSSRKSGRRTPVDDSDHSDQHSEEDDSAEELDSARSQQSPNISKSGRRHTDRGGGGGGGGGGDIDLLNDMRDKFALLQQENNALRKVQQNQKQLLNEQQRAQAREKDRTVTEAALRTRVTDLLQQVRKLQVAQKAYLQQNPNVAASIEQETKAIKNHLTEFQVNIQARMEAELVETSSRLARSGEELRVFQQFLKVSLLSYQKEILRLRKELVLFKSLAGNKKGQTKKQPVPALDALKISMRKF
jgi:chromosome segregation ATPase